MAKFSLVPFVILSMLSITISSCKDDEEESIPTPEIQQQSKKLVGVKTYNENNDLFSTTTYSYYSNGKVSEKKIVFETERIPAINHTDKYEYNGDSITITEEYKNYSIEYSCFTNPNGYFTSMIDQSENETVEYSWGYSDNHCISHTLNQQSGTFQSTYAYEFNWKGDDMESAKLDNYSSGNNFSNGPYYHVYSNQNGEMIANKGGIGINLLSLTKSDIFEPGVLHGYNSAHLPIGVYTDDINNMSDLHWVINEDGYPLKVSIDTTITYEFTWE